MKSNSVTIQMKPLQQYFHMVVFIKYVVLTFKSVDEITRCYHSNETSLAELLHGTVYLIRFRIKTKRFDFVCGWIFPLARKEMNGYFVRNVYFKEPAY